MRSTSGHENADAPFLSRFLREKWGIFVFPHIPVILIGPSADERRGGPQR